MKRKLGWREAINAALADVRAGLPEKYAKLIRTHGASRKKAVDFITGLGGYSDRHDRYAVSWSAKAYGADLDCDHLLASEARHDFSFCPQSSPNYPIAQALGVAAFQRAHRGCKEHLWEWATEEAWESFKDDDGTFWGADRDTEFGLRGRSGGHLVMERCGHVETKCSAEELAERLLAKEQDFYTGRNSGYDVPNDWVAHLFLVCVQTEADWGTRADIDKEVEFRAAWRLWAMVDGDGLRSAVELLEEGPDAIEGIRELEALAATHPTTPAAAKVLAFAKLLLGIDD